MGNLIDFVTTIRQKRGAALMGVVNATPDSFYDGGRHLQPEAAREHIDRLLAAGADLLDIGGESTRPGAATVPPEEQWRRIEPALDYALERGAFVSVDTTHPQVAEMALSRGAHLVNDVSCLADAELAAVVARHHAVLLLMHSRGSMQNMPGFSVYPASGYEDVVRDVRSEWLRARDRAVEQGLPAERIWFDPGFGFHKNAEQSLELLARLDELVDLSEHVVVGPSRKSFLSAGDGSPPEQRLGGTIAACLHAVSLGATILRVHDVFDVAQALRIHRSLTVRRPRDHLRNGLGPMTRGLDA